MKIKSFFAKPFASYVHRVIRREMHTALADQKRILDQLIQVGRKTEFGKAINLSEVNDYQSFKESVGIQDYEGMKPWIEKIKEGRQNVLWKGRPI